MMDLSRTVFEINGDQSKITNLPPPRVFSSLAKGAPLELDIVAWGRNTRMMELPLRERSLTITLAVWIHYTNVTDRRRDKYRLAAKTAITHSEQTYITFGVLYLETPSF